MEVALDVQEGIKDRLSVQYFDSNYYYNYPAPPEWDYWAGCGGNLEYFTDFYFQTGQVIPWSNTNAYYGDYYRSCEDGTAVSASSISTSPDYAISSVQNEIVPNTHRVSKSEVIASIKNVLHQGKAIWFAFTLPDGDAWNDFGHFWWYQSERVSYDMSKYDGDTYDYYYGGGHAVLLVGYDDTNPADSYWIMVNSWGTAPRRPNGIFHVNMDMNYDTQLYDPWWDEWFYNLWWETLDVDFSIQPRLSASLVSPANGGAVTSAVELKAKATARGSPIPGASVTFYVNGEAVGSSISDSGGYASYLYSQPLLGTYSWHATAESSGYDPGTSPTWSFTLLGEVAVKARTQIFETELSGVRVRVDRKYYTTPFTMLLQGPHKFTARSTVSAGGIRYRFAGWEDSGVMVSTSTSVTLNVQSTKTLYAVYTPPRYTVSVYVKDANTRKSIQGAEVLFDNSPVGLTDSSGRLPISGIYPGEHHLTIKASGYNEFDVAISVKRNTRFKGNLTPLGGLAS
jgi:hypothetical protein